MRWLYGGWMASLYKGSVSTSAARALLSFAVSVVLSLGLAQSARAGGDEIEGTVTSAVTKAPVQGVEVCAGQYQGQQGCVSTKADGTYVVPAPPVSLSVEFNAPVGSGLVAHTYYDGVYLQSEATNLTVPVGEVFAGIDAELQPEGRVEGVVTNATTKAPVADVEVCSSPLAAWPEVLTCVSTDAHGVYELQGLAPIQYRVKFNSRELNYLPETAQREYKLYPSVTVGHKTANVDVALPEGGQILGRVKSKASGLPLSGTQVCASGFGPSLETKCAKTDAEGRYVIAGLETSSYHVSFGPERPYVSQQYDEGKTVWVNQGETLAEVNASVLTGTSISGVVTSASTGRPMREVEVCVTERVGEEAKGYCTEPNEAGEYQLIGVETSSDTIEFRPKSNIYEYVGESTSLHTTDGEVITGIDAALKARYGAISGRVLGASGGGALSDAEVCAEDVDTAKWRCTKTNGQGQYEITFLSSGRYIVEFSTPYQNPGYVTEFYEGKLSANEAEPVTVGAGSTASTIDAELVEHQSAGSRIAGVVMSASSLQSLAGIEVCAYDTEEAGEGLFGKCATTGADGAYSMAGLADGEYLVEFSSPSSSALDYITQYYDETEFFEQAIAVKVSSETADLAIDARMREGGRIAGRVTDASSAAPLPETLVCALVSLSEAVDCAVTGMHGEYAIAGVPAGSYVVGFDAGKSYDIQYYDDQTSFSAAKTMTVAVGKSTSGVDAAMQPVAGARTNPPPKLDEPPQLTPSSPVLASSLPRQSTSSGAGSSTTTSPAISVPPAVTARVSRIVVSRSTAMLHLSCGGKTTCDGSIELTSQVLVSGHDGKKHRETLVLGRGNFSLATGNATAVLRLTAVGRRRLAQAKHHLLAASLVLSVQGGKTTVKSVTVS